MVSCITGGFFTVWTTRGAHKSGCKLLNKICSSSTLINRHYNDLESQGQIPNTWILKAPCENTAVWAGLAPGLQPMSFSLQLALPPPWGLTGTCVGARSLCPKAITPFCPPQLRAALETDQRKTPKKQTWVTRAGQLGIPGLGAGSRHGI